MTRCRLTRYEAAGAEETRRRLARLYALLLDAVRERDLEPVLAYAREIARQRFAEGFDLQEVQSAINVLEEAVWRRVVKEIPPDGLAEALGLVSTVLGVCKDTMASSYVAPRDEAARDEPRHDGALPRHAEPLLHEHHGLSAAAAQRSRAAGAARSGSSVRQDVRGEDPLPLRIRVDAVLEVQLLPPRDALEEERDERQRPPPSRGAAKRRPNPSWYCGP